MELSFKKTYENRTWKYLLPSLKFYGNDLIDRLYKIKKLAVGIFDTSVEGTDFSEQNNIYILCDTDKDVKYFKAFQIWLREKPYYVVDYIYNAERTKDRCVMVVIKIPEKFDESYNHFLKGEYSLMYKPSEVKKYFRKNTDIYNVLIHTKEVENHFIRKINEFLHLNISFKTCIKGEFDIPLIREQEIFNSVKESSIYHSTQDSLW